MYKLKKLVIILLSLVLIGGIGCFSYLYFNLNKIYVKDGTFETTSDSKIEGDEELKGAVVEGVTNILLVGTDGESVEKNNRSDSIMLATINNNSKNIKITSVARDTYVDIPGHSQEKITHAFAYNGIDLLKEVFEKNFNIKVDKYIAVNFVSFMDVIDEIGGVEVVVEEKDIEEINNMIYECYEYYYSGKDRSEIEYIEKSGKQILNGYQALAFSRIRYTDSAYARDNRHREVIESIFSEFLESSPGEIKRCIDIVLENTKTDISPLEMINLAYTCMEINDREIDKFEFPLEEYRNGHIINNRTGWVIEWEKEPNLKYWHNFIEN